MPETIQQAAVIPYRVIPDGPNCTLEVALVTNRSGDAWIIPKGIIDPGEEPHEAAARECVEEAGLVGTVTQVPIGSYSYEKWGLLCAVRVYLLSVTQELDEWDESFIRDRVWLPMEQAATRVREQEVAELIRELPELIGRE